MNSRPSVCRLCLCLVVLVPALTLLGQVGNLSQATASQSAAAARAYGDISLAFEPNEGQASPDVRFTAKARGLTALLKDDEATLITPSGTVAGGQSKRSVVHMTFPGANLHRPRATDRMVLRKSLIVASFKMNPETPASTNSRTSV